MDDFSRKLNARPSRKETDADLLKYQSDFLASSSKSATAVISKRPKRQLPSTTHGDAGTPTGSASGIAVDSVTVRGDVGTATEKDVVTMGDLASGLAYSMASPTLNDAWQEAPCRKKRTNSKVAATDDPDSLMDRCDTHITKVLSEIVEHDIEPMAVKYPSRYSKQGFPLASRRKLTDQSLKTTKKKSSIFAKQFIHDEEPDVPASPHRVQNASFTPPQWLVNALDAQEARRIDEENRTTLAAMSEKEILEEQENLVKTLDPCIIALLTKKKLQKLCSTSKKPEVVKPTNGREERALIAAENEAMNTKNTNESHSMKQHHPVAYTTPSTKDGTSTELSELQVIEKGQWLNMNDVEVDKMEWMRDLPPPATVDSKTSLPARFDLQGNLVPADAQIPSHLGLHHHGDEPQRAGYRLDELFQLARSANMQQRTLAITVIARIITNARHGAFCECTSVALIPALIEGGIVFVLRWALDDSTDNTITAAVLAMHALLVSPKDEEAADYVFFWHRGSEMSSLSRAVNDTGDTESETQTDATLLRLDVVKGLLKMQLLPRLRYLLDVWRPDAACLRHCCELLIRVARHSAEAAYQLMQCPRLISVLCNEFLPTTWCMDIGSAAKCWYGSPIPSVLKLMRVICMAGRNMTASLVSQYNLMTVVFRYLAEEPEDLQLPLSDAISLQIEAVRTWRVCLHYGLATSCYVDLYPMLMNRVRRMCDDGQLHTSVHCGLITVLETVVHISGETEQLRHQRTPESSSVEALPAISWSQVSALIEPVELVLQNILSRSPARDDSDFLSCCINFVATYYSVAHSRPGYDIVSSLQHIKQLCDTLMMPFLKSRAFREALMQLRQCSVLLFDAGASREISPSLPELGALLGAAAHDCPVTQQVSPLGLLLAMARLMRTMGSLQKDMVKSMFHVFLEDEDIVLYLRQICKRKKAPASVGDNHFGRFENLLQYELIQMAKMHGEVDMQLYHQVSLELLKRIHVGDESIAHGLVSSVLFNAQFLADVRLDDLSMMYLEDRLMLDEPIGISSATQSSMMATKRGLLEDLQKHWAPMRGAYLTILCGLQAVNGGLRRSSLLTGQVGERLIPLDWIYLPIVQIYASSRLEPSNELSPAAVTMVANMLRCVYAFEVWREGHLCDISEAVKLSRMMCVLLLGSDLFLDSSIQCYMAALLKLYCSRARFLNQINLKEAIPGVASFHDLYMNLINEFEAVSFGDTLFGCFVLFPLQQQHEIELRKTVWAEHPLLLRAMFVPIKELCVPLSRFLEPEESALELVQLYAGALLSKRVSARWAPVPYLIAVHHVNRYAFTMTGEQPARLDMLAQVLRSRDTETSHDVVYYKKANVEMARGMELYGVLPPHRQLRVDTLTKR